MGWPSTVNFSKDGRVAPALPRPAGAVWAHSNGTIASPATAPIIINRFISVSQLALAADTFNGFNTFALRPSAARREIALPRADGVARLVHLHGQIVQLAVELLRHEAERVLVVQFVDDAIELAEQIAQRGQLEVAAAGRRRDLRHALVGLLHRGLVAPLRRDPASAEALRRALLRHRRQPFHADGVDHDVVVLSALHLVLHGLGVAAEVERLVDTITQRENDAAALLEQELVDCA